MHERSCKQNPSKVPGNWAGRQHSAGTKKQISASRIQYLDAHPDQVPYVLNHYSKGSSYPELYWEAVLKSAGVQYDKEQRVGRFRIDFAVGKIALEIDGEQHYVDNRIVESNKRRDEALSAKGWETIRVRWAMYQKLNSDERLQFRTRLLDKLKQPVS